MNIPNQLKNSKFRFIKIIPGTKRPKEKDWSLTNNYKFTEKEFQDYIKNAKSYGVVCGFGNLAIVDADDERVAKDVMFKLPKTFTVKTGSGKWHFYFKIPDLDTKIILSDDDDGNHFGEVQYWTEDKTGTQALAPGSVHPNGNIYEVLYNENIAEIDKDTLLTALEPFLKKKKFKNVSLGKGFETDITKVAAKISGLDRQGNGLQGPHPIHGSDGGMNFRIDPDKNKWHCFRHNTGGDALSLIGVLEGIIKCEDCVPGYFSDNPDAFKKILKVAHKYGYEGLDTEPEVRLFRKQGNKGVLDVESIVKYIKSECKFITVRDCTGRQPHIYVYEDGYYKLNGEDYITNLIKKIFEGRAFKAHYKREVMDYIQTENIVDREEIEPPKHLVNLNNGVLNLRNKKLVPHSPEYYFLYKIPLDYKPKAQCPKIMKYFKSTLSPTFVKFSQELFGYCLYFDYNIAGIFYLYGTGGNGKSVWIHLLEEMLGTKNVSNKSIDSLVRYRFTSALLYGKLANVCGELMSSVLKDTDMVKRLSAGDSVQAEFKGKDGFDFQNRAKIITSCNSVPYCTDMTDGWYQRQYIIPFLKKFRGTKKDNVDLKYELTADKKEMEGLLKWAIDGLYRLLNNKKFTYPYDRVEKYLMYQKNASYFLDRYYRKGGDFNTYIPMEEIREHYHQWCVENDIPEDSENALARELTYRKIPNDRMQIDGEYVYIRRYIERI